MALTKVNRGGLNTGISDSSDATALTIDSSENLGIGTSLTPSASSAGSRFLTVAGSTDGILQLTKNGSGGGAIASAGGTGMLFYTHTGTVGSENYTERMRIASGGELLIGTTTSGSSSSLHVQGNGTLSVFQVADANSGTARNAILFRNSSSAGVGTIQVNSTSVAYNTSSDHRLKENVDYTFDATTRLKQLKPARFNFIADADTTVDGFLAHEVQSVVPEAITGTHNEVDDDGNAVMQGIDQSKLVPLLVKTIQELEARITALEGA